MFLEATMSEWPRKFRSTSGFTGTQGYCRLGLIDFHNIFIPYFFEVKKSIFRSFTKLPCSGDLEKPGQLPVLQKLEGTDDWVLWIFFIPYVSGVKEFISRCFSKLPCPDIPGDLEYPGQLPVFAQGILVA